jgi:hypothetical protein
LNQVLEGRKAAPYKRDEDAGLIIATESWKSSGKVDAPSVKFLNPSYGETAEAVELRPPAAPTNIFDIGEIRSVAMTPATDASKPNSAHVMAKEVAAAPDLPTVAEDETKANIAAVGPDAPNA